MKNLLSFIIILSVASGCAHVVSKEMRERADTSIAPSMLFAEPDDYRGRIVILGGDIVETGNERDGTYIEVVQKSLDYRGRPAPSDRTAGRFLIFHDGYLDPAIYERGKMVTVAGEVMGEVVRSLGEIDYSYPLIKSRELYLLKPGYGDIPVFFGVGLGVVVD